MARPTDADSAATYDSIVSATLELLDELGSADSVSLRKVASRAEVSLGTIQYYFENKDTLLEACLDGYYARLTKVVNDLIRWKTNGTLTGAPLLDHASRELYRWARRERGLLALRMSTNAQRGELHERRQSQFMGTLISQVVAALAEHITIPEHEARIAIQFLATSLTRAVLFSDAEVEVLTDSTGDEARTRIEDFFVTTVRRVLRPGEG